MRKMLMRLRPFAPLVVLAALTIVGGSLANLQMPALLADVINGGVARGDSAYVLRVGGQMMAVSVLAILCAVGTSYCSSRISTGFGATLRADIFRRVQSFSAAEVDRFGAASLITRTTNDVMQMQHFVMMLLRTVLSAPVTAIGGVYMAFGHSRELSGVILLAMPLVVLIVVGISRRTIPLTRRMQQRLDEVNLVLREKLRGVRVIRAFHTEGHERARFRNANAELSRTSVRMQRSMGLMSPLVMLVLNGATVLIIWLGAGKVQASLLEVGDILATVEYVMQILMSMMMISMIFIRIPRAVASADRINAVLSQETAIVGGSVTEGEEARRGELRFEGVTFSYPGADEPALREVSFTARRGQTVAIIGGTGSGKSTLLGLIPRFYDPQAGRITLDGVDIRDYDLAALRGKIGYVTQKAVLFAGSIAENIGWGKQGASPEEIRRAAEVAQAADFIAARENGYADEVSQGGANLSGGQKQRLSIARAVVRRPDLYLFDDSFSALDFRTDANLRRALQEVKGESTVLIVAQRVSTILDADLILVLEEGGVVGQGTHAELMQNCPVYREIVHSQLSEEEVAD